MRGSFLFIIGKGIYFGMLALLRSRGNVRANQADPTTTKIPSVTNLKLLSVFMTCNQNTLRLQLCLFLSDDIEFRMNVIYYYKLYLIGARGNVPANRRSVKDFVLYCQMFSLKPTLWISSSDINVECSSKRGNNR